MVNLDAVCLLPLNILNEKMYIFLYFWMVRCYLQILSKNILVKGLDCKRNFAFKDGKIRALYSGRTLEDDSVATRCLTLNSFLIDR